jgi:hypothetical protein
MMEVGILEMTIFFLEFENICKQAEHNFDILIEYNNPFFKKT